MTTIRARCLPCGDLHLHASKVTVRSRADQWAYRIVCPSCGAIIVRSTVHRIARLLIDAGCPVETWTLPYRGPRVGPPICEQDITRFVTDLDAWTHAEHHGTAPD